MAIERNPNDPYQASATNDEMMRQRAEQIDAELQADPELAEGPASGGRNALFAIALVAILGVGFLRPELVAEYIAGDHTDGTDDHLTIAASGRNVSVATSSGRAGQRGLQ